MDWQFVLIILGAWSSAAISIVFMARLLRTTLRERLRQELSKVLLAPDELTWITTASRAFLGFFDGIYSGGKASIWQGIWAGLLLSLLATPLIRFGLFLNGDTAQDTADLLLAALGLSGLLIVVATIISASDKDVKIGGGFGIVAAVVGGSVNSITENIGNGILRAIISGVEVGFLAGIAFVIALTVTISIRKIIAAVSTVKLAVHPLKTLVSFMLFIGLVSLVRIHEAETLLKEIKTEWTTVLTFLTFTYFLTSMSTLKSRWILTKVSTAGFNLLAGWLVLDMALSVAIFLFLPLTFWEISEFSEAIRFSGSRPWVGILFWSTFSTSMVFYLFICTALFLSFSHSLIQSIQIPFDFEKEPEIVLAFVSLFWLTVLFMIVGIVWAESNGVI